jgi:cation transport ATPase
LRAQGDAVTAGSYNLDSVVDVRVDSVGEGTRFAQIVNLMESASLQKPRLAQLADRWPGLSWSWCCWRRWLPPSGGGPPTRARP